jgi:hypothetical protein
MSKIIQIGDRDSGGRIWDLPDDMLQGLAEELQKKATSSPTVPLSSSNVIGLAEALIGIIVLRQRLQQQANQFNQFSGLIADAVRDAGGVITARPGRPYLALSAIPGNEEGEGEDRVAQEIHFVWIPQDNEPMIYTGDIIKWGKNSFESIVVGMSDENTYFMRDVLEDGLGQINEYSRDTLFDMINDGSIEIVARTPIIESAERDTEKAKEEIEAKSQGNADISDQGEGDA